MIVPSAHHRRLLLCSITLFFLTLTCSQLANAQSSCDNEPQGSGESMSAHITPENSGTQIGNDSVVTAGTRVLIHSVATANGQCIGKAWGNCNPSPCECIETGTVYQRTINHTNVNVDITSSGVWNGSYFVGTVQFTQAYDHVLDSSSANTTGPNGFTLALPGTYTFRVQGVINTTPCNMQPNLTNEVSITIYVAPNDNADESGPSNGAGGGGGGDSCPIDGGPPPDPGEPINVTNGNMYIQQTDYRSSGFGGLSIVRTYNSKNQFAGLFGYGWSSILDESIVVYGPDLLRLSMPDGRAVYLARQTGGNTYTPKLPLNFYGQVVKNVDNTFTLTFQDGRVHQFNTNGRLVSFADRNGNITTLTLNASGNPTTLTDPSGRTLTFTYDSQTKIGTMSDSTGTIATYAHAFWGRLTSVTYADGSKYVYTDTFQGNNIYLTTVKDALNNVLESHTYDSQGRAITSERGGNGTNRYTFTYVSATETHVTDALNRVSKYFFDTSNGRNVVTRIEGGCACGPSQVSQWTYDAQLNVTSQTDGLNHTTSFTYDANGNRLTRTNATGTVTYTYNSLGQVLTLTDQMSGVWTYTYDATGNLLTVKDPLNKTTTFTYNAQGQLLTVTDPRNNTTTFTYHATNRDLIRVTDALNNDTDMARDARGRLTSTTNELSQVTSYEYDLAGRLKKVIYPDTNFILFTYDLGGRRTKIKDPRGYETTFAYDAAYRLTSVTNADNKATSYGYDSMSNLTSVTDALSRTTNLTYDDFDRVIKVKYPEPTAGAGRPEENYTYDFVGNLLTKTDQSSGVTTFTYDSADRMISMVDAAQKTTTFEYNARSLMTAVVDPLSQRYEFSYDALGRRTQEKKGTATMSYGYDNAGNRNQRTDFNGTITNYTYDALNRLTTISYPDTTSATYGYDVLSRLTTATNAAGTVTIGYDNRGRVSSVTDVFGQVVSYGYDANSNRTQLSLNAATSATYQYDVINRLTQLTDNASLNTTFAYDATDKLTSRTLPNGVVSTYQYDALNRLTRLKHDKGANTLADFQYQFNTVNNITQMTDGAGAHNYSYDPLYRLTGATHPAGQTNESYTYDDVGNRTASSQGPSYSYQAFNRLVAANGASFGYDTNGNQVSKTDASGSWTFTWDYENRLKQAALSGGVTVTYTYDAIGRRVQRTSSAGGTTKFVYDGVDVIRDLDGSGNTIADYLNGLGVDDKLRQVVSGTASYFLSDHLGTTRALADASGTVTASLTYDSFGATSSTATRYTFTGREQDADIGLLYYRARWYDPKQGRFMSEDPIGFSGGMNWYSYVDNSPLNATDPYGLAKCGDPKYCAKLLQQIIDKVNGFWNDWRPYKDAGFFDKGGKTIHKGGKEIVTKPGGHYQQLADRQRGIIKDVLEYVEKCLKDGDDPPDGLKRGFEAAKHHIPWPVNIPTNEELRLQIEANRQMEEFWTKILKGDLVLGAFLLRPAMPVLSFLPRWLPLVPAY